jgi:hypothetical protein
MTLTIMFNIIKIKSIHLVNKILILITSLKLFFSTFQSYSIPICTRNQHIDMKFHGFDRFVLS